MWYGAYIEIMEKFRRSFVQHMHRNECPDVKVFHSGANVTLVDCHDNRSCVQKNIDDRNLLQRLQRSPAASLSGLTESRLFSVVLMHGDQHLQ